MRLAAIAAAVAGGVVTLAAGFKAYETFEAESFSDRRMDRPTPAECQAARVLLIDMASRRAELVRSVGAPGERIELLAFAWNSSGVRAGRGADWRACKVLGRFVRGLGMARLNSGGRGPSLYISRLQPAVNGEAAAWISFFPPDPTAYNPAGAKQAQRRWEAHLARRGKTGDWRLERLDSTPAS